MNKYQIADRDILISLIQEAIHGNSIGRYQHRLHVILYVLLFNNIKNASIIYQEPVRTIQSWMKRFLSIGLNGLYDKEKSGRKPRLTESQEELLKEHLSISPTHFNYNQANWDGKLLSHHIFEKFNVTIGVRQCQKLFHKLGYSLQRPRTVSVGNKYEQEEFKKKRNS